MPQDPSANYALPLMDFQLLLRTGVLATCLVAGCTGTADTEPPILSEELVLELANRVAKQERSDFAKYDVTGCHYEYTANDGTWTVFFELKPPTPPGGHFMVIVDDGTRETELMYGE